MPTETEKRVERGEGTPGGLAVIGGVLLGYCLPHPCLRSRRAASRASRQSARSPSRISSRAQSHLQPHQRSTVLAHATIV